MRANILTIGTRANHANLHAVFAVPASVAIHHKQTLLQVQIVDGALAIDQETSLLNRINREMST